MDYRIAFWCLLTACIVKFFFGNKFYIGPDEAKYEAADYAILTRR